LSQWEAAARACTAALQIKPEDLANHYLRGIVSAKAQQHEKAISDFTKVIELGGSDWGIWAWRANSRYALRRWDLAAAEFTCVLKKETKVDWVWRNRGSAYFELGQGEKAAADFAEAAELARNVAQTWRYRALAALAQGDAGVYRRICADLYELFGTTDDATTAELVVSNCVVLPDSGVAPTRVLLLAEKAHKSDLKSVHYLELYGAALYRAGRYAEAVTRLEEAISLQKNDGTAWMRLFLAMSHQRLGRADTTKHWLAKAVQAIEDSKPDVWLDWRDRVQLQVLRREAETLIKPPTRPSP
jgi:tetratricopeptide (TPR) repeat protein